MLNQELPNEEGSKQQRCAICFLDKPLLFAPCTHNACQDCFERILLATNPSNDIDIDIFNNNNNNTDASNIEALEDSIIASCPTRGRCPFCRTYLSMFDLKYRTNSSTFDNNDMNNNNDGSNLVFEQKDDEKGHYHNNPIVANGTADPQRFAYRHLLNLKEIPLNDLAFTDHGKRSSNTNRKISFKDGQAEISIYESSTSGEKELIRSRQFDNKYHYHEKSMTFSGVVDWMKGSGPLEGVAKWEVILQFSSDLRYIRRGAIIKTRYEKNKNDDDNDIDDSIKRRYPLDGTWKLQYLKRQQDLDVVDDRLPTSNITVVGNKFMHQTTLYNICIPRETGNVNDDNSNSSGSDHKVHFDWAIQDGDNQPYRQVVESGLDLRENPHGPDVGSVVIWTVDHPDYHRISWLKLETKGIPPIQVEHLAGRGIMFYAERDNSPSQTDKITFNSSSPWGNAFIQMQTLGLASYHFVPRTANEEEFVYISYEHEQCSSWPSLDNGELVPYCVPFVNHSYDSETRTFRGEIRWMDVYGTTWQGHDTWIYEIVFDSKFTCIVKGDVKMSHVNRFETISSYGEDLIYCNVALVEIIKAEVNADLSASHVPLDENRNENNVEHSISANGNDDDNMENNTLDSTDTNDTATANYNEFSQHVQLCTAGLKTRLRNEGTSERTLVMISRISLGAINPMLNPIDYNGVQRE